MVENKNDKVLKRRFDNKLENKDSDLIEEARLKKVDALFGKFDDFAEAAQRSGFTEQDLEDLFAELKEERIKTKEGRLSETEKKEKAQRDEFLDKVVQKILEDDDE